jgi:hypothetical protein
MFLNSPSSACGGTHLSKKLCYFSKAHADTPTPRYADTSLPPQTPKFLNSPVQRLPDCFSQRVIFAG